MLHHHERPDARFAVQQIDHGSWARATAASLAADFRHGHRDVVDGFLDSPAGTAFSKLATDLDEWSPRELDDFVERERGHSLLFLVMMLTGACNANCDICFTDRRAKASETTPQARSDLLRQAKELGARYIYVPGEGEPTIDKGFWAFLDACRDNHIEAIVFTNGIALSNDVQCRRAWGLSVDQAIERLVNYPVNFYVKWWTTHPELAAEMLRVPPRMLPYGRYDEVSMPASLARLLDSFPRHRLGIETVIERRNADEIGDVIVPFAQEHGLSRIVEMIQHNGRTLGDGAYDPSPEQAERLAPLLSVTSCAMASVKAVVTSRGYLSPRIAVLEHQIPKPACNVVGKNLFAELHSTRYVVERRYDLATCLCETMPAALAAESAPTVQVAAGNVAPVWEKPEKVPAVKACGANCACAAKASGAPAGAADEHQHEHQHEHAGL
jgi:hypothetical protein